MSEVPQSTSTDLDRSALVVKQRCGNCKHLKRIAHPAYGKVCKDLGMLEISKPCNRFSADPTKIRFSKDRHARNAVEFLRDLSDDRLALFASLINEERKTRRYGFSIGETLYILAFGSDYLSNYRRVKVVSADKTYVNVVGADGFTAMVFHKSVMSAKKWQRKEKELIANERITDPRYARYTQSLSHAEMQIQEVRNKLEAQEFDSTNRHNFAASTGKMVKVSSRYERERATPINFLMKEREISTPIKVR